MFAHSDHLARRVPLERRERIAGSAGPQREHHHVQEGAEGRAVAAQRHAGRELVPQHPGSHHQERAGAPPRSHRDSARAGQAVRAGGGEAQGGAEEAERGEPAGDQQVAVAVHRERRGDLASGGGQGQDARDPHAQQDLHREDPPVRGRQQPPRRQGVRQGGDPRVDHHHPQEAGDGLGSGAGEGDLAGDAGRQAGLDPEPHEDQPQAGAGGGRGPQQPDQ